MASLTIKNIPDDLFQKLKLVAKEHRRSMNSEVIICLESQLETAEPDLASSLERIKNIRDKIEAGVVSDSDIGNAIIEGRP